MKKILIILVCILAAVLLASCIPEEPNEMLPFCQGQYDLLLEQDADFPHSFIGACVSYLQTGKPTAYVSLCGYEPFWQMIEDGSGVVLSSKKECMQYIKNFEE